MRPREIITATFPVEMQSSLVIKLILPPDYLFLTSVYKSFVAEEGESSLVLYHTFPKPTLPRYLWLRFSVIISLKHSTMPFQISTLLFRTSFKAIF